MHKKGKTSQGLVLYTLIAIVVLVAIFGLNQVGKKKEDSNQTTNELPSISGQPIAGIENAKVSIVEFGDYKCPSCKAWGEQVWPQLKRDYIDTGVASFAYVNTLLHGEESKLAAQASEVVYMNDPERFWDFHKALFDEQPQANHDALWVTESKVLEVAQASISGLDVDKFRDKLNSVQIKEKLDQDQMLVNQFNIQQTPTIMINNIIISNPFDYESIRKAIDEEAK